MSAGLYRYSARSAGGELVRGSMEAPSADAVLANLRNEGLLVAGMIGDPDPYIAAMNALQRFRVSDVVISTLPAEKSGWLRANLPERLSDAARIPVDHVVVELDDAGVKA